MVIPFCGRYQTFSCICLVQLCLITWYVTKYKLQSQRDSLDYTSDIVPRGPENIRGYRQKVINHVHSLVSRSRETNVTTIISRVGEEVGDVVSDVKVEDVDVKNAVFQCDMDKYLSKRQDLCRSVLNSEYLDNKECSNSTTDVPKYVKDYSCDVENVQNNCNAVREAYLFGKERTMDNEKRFPLAFAIKIHGYPNQAHRLLRYIYLPHNVYCVHVDKKANDVIYQSFQRLKRCFDNVIVIEDRVNVVYSSIRQVEAELRCMSALKQSRVKWKYYINLTGQEFMLKTNLELVKYLEALNGTNDIQSNNMPVDMFHRFKQQAMFNNSNVIITKVRKEPFRKDVKVRKGSAYGMFSRDFVNFVLNHPLVKEFCDWLSNTYAPEETIWASLNAIPEAPGGDVGYRTYQNGKYRSRAVKWQMNNTVRCYGKFIRRICIYGVGDLPFLRNSEQMVANKFYEHFEPLALDCLETDMYHKLINM